VSERIPEQTLERLVGPARRHEIPWYALPKLAGPGEHKGRSATWLSIYGKDAERGEQAITSRPALRLVEVAS
jgi:hypothetical protein